METPKIIRVELLQHNKVHAMSWFRKKQYMTIDEAHKTVSQKVIDFEHVSDAVAFFDHMRFCGGNEVRLHIELQVNNHAHWSNREAFHPAVG